MNKTKIRILTYNIHKGFDSFGIQFVLDQIKESLLKTEADILFLQEIEGKSIESNHSPQFEYIADTVWKHFSYGKNAAFEGKHHGNAILSKYPIIFEENINISNHRLEQRGLLHCIIEILPGKKKIHLFNTHIDLLSVGRKKQIAKIKSRIKSHTKQEDPVIFTGDFNDWAQEVSPMLKESFIELKEAFTEMHGSPAKTFPSFLPILALDRVYYRGIKPTSCVSLNQKPWNKLSDHIPLLVDFEI